MLDFVFRRTVCGAMFVLFVVGCGGGSSSGGGNGWLKGGSSNDSALLNGANVGDCTAGPPPRKVVPLSVTAGTDQFSFGTAYIVGSVLVPEYARFYVPVTNIGITTRCFVNLAGYTWLDSQGATLVAGGTSYVDGSTRDVGAGIYTSTCLAPGETGMLIDIKNAPGMSLDLAVASVTFSISGSDNGVLTVPAASVVPQSYSLAGADLTVRFKNVGAGPAGIGTGFLISSLYVVLDAGGLPVDFSYFDSVTPASGLLAAGAEGSLFNAGSDGAEGCGPHAWVISAFDNPATVAATTGALTIAPPVFTATDIPTADLGAVATWRHSRTARLQAFAAVARARHAAATGVVLP